MTRARLIVLLIALAAGAAAAYIAANQQPTVQVVQPVQHVDMDEVLVAKSDISIGRKIIADDMEWRPWPQSAVPAEAIRKTANPAAQSQLLGAIARASMTAGDPIREGKLIKANGSGYMAAVLPSGMRAVSTEISPEAGAGGFILPNDRVDVILTSAEKTRTEESFRSRTILTNVRVLAIDQAVEEKSGQRNVIGKIATLELQPKQAEKLALARRLGTLSLVLRGLSESAEADGSQDDSLSPRNTVTIVRFGLPLTQ